MASGIGARALQMGTLPEWLVIATGTVFMLFILLFRRRRLAPSLSRAASNPRCGAHTSNCVGVGQRHFSDGFDRSVNWHLVRLTPFGHP